LLSQAQQLASSNPQVGFIKTKTHLGGFFVGCTTKYRVQLTYGKFYADPTAYGLERRVFIRRNKNGTSN